MVLKLSVCSSASPHMAAVGLGFWNSEHVVLKLSIRSSALPCSATVLMGFWNSEKDETRKWEARTLLYGRTDVNVEIVMLITLRTSIIL